MKYQTSLCLVALSLAVAAGSGCRFRSDRNPDNSHNSGSSAPIDVSEQALRNAEDLRRQGFHQEALAEFERAIAINPELSAAYIGAAELHRTLGNYDAAEERARTATRLEPRNFDAWFEHGLALQLLERLQEAVRSYLTALTIRPNDFEANLNLATAYLQMAEPDQALPYGLRAVSLNNQSGPARVNLGAIYDALGDHAAALTEYQQAAELMELTPELMLNLAQSLAQNERYEEASNTLDRLTQIAPSAAAYERWGSVLFRLSRYTESLARFRKALEHDPDYYPALNGVGVCLLNEYVWSDKSNDAARAEAIRALRRSLQVNPDQPKIKELLTRYGS